MRNAMMAMMSLVGGSVLGGLAGCDSGTTTVDMKPDSAMVTTATPDLGCYPTATTYVQLLNACTTAQAIDKTPVTPLLNKDGTLPPLP